MNLTKISLCSEPDPRLSLISGFLVFNYLAFILQVYGSVSLMMLVVISIFLVPFFIFKGEVGVVLKKSPKSYIYILLSLIIYSFIWIIDISFSSELNLSDFERPIKTLLSVFLFLFFLVVKIDYRFVVAGLCVSLANFSLSLYVSNGLGADGRYGLGLNPNALAYLVVAEVLLLSVLLTCISKIWGRFMISIFVLLGLMVSIYTGSRVVFVSYVGFSILCIWFFKSVISRKLIYFFITAFLSSLLLSSNSIMSERFDQIIPELIAIYNGDFTGSLGHRAGLYKLWYFSIQDYFPAGANDVELSDMAELSLNRGEISTSERNWMMQYSHFHNEYLNTLIFRGLIGLFSLLMLVAIPFIMESKRRKLLLLSVCTPMIMGGLVDVPLAGGSYLVFIFLMIALVTNLEFLDTKN